MTPLKPPKGDEFDVMELEVQIEDMHRAITDAAEKAGWTVETIAAALHSLADCYMMAAAENARTAEAVKAARDSRH